MSVPVVAFFNNKGGVGKTSLAYHLAWMYALLGGRVLAADLDPQANLTAAFLDDQRVEQLWPDGPHPDTVLGAVQPILDGTGDIDQPTPVSIDDHLHLLAGDLGLSPFENDLSAQWPLCLDGRPRPFRVISAFWRVLQQAAGQCGAGVILVDVGPNLGALNRAALVATDFVVVPLAPDVFSLQGLRNLGPTLRTWRQEWHERLGHRPADPPLTLPSGRMEPVGYVVLQHAVRLDRPVWAYERWIRRIPDEYRQAVLDQSEAGGTTDIDQDPNCLALIKHYRSLMAMAQEAQKPMFSLLPADGAIGAHATAARRVRDDFEHLAHRIAERVGYRLD